MSAMTMQTSQAQSNAKEQQARAPSGHTTNGTAAKLQTKPIQWSTSTGASVLQHLAATKEQHKLKSSQLTSNDLINSKPGSSAAKPAPTNVKKVSPNAASLSKNGNRVTSATAQTSSPSFSAPSNVASSSSSPPPNVKMSKKQADTTAGADVKPARRKKANRACSHCQKAHLVCADTRPCDRCVKKGLADTCTDGARKKAKYLLDEDELEELKREKDRKVAAANGDLTDSTMDDSRSWNPAMSSFGPGDVSGNGMQSFSNHMNLGDMSTSHMHPAATATNMEGDVYFSPSTASNGAGVKNMFGSENASLEYSILSSMLNGIDPSWLSGSPDQQGAETTDMGNVLTNNNNNHNIAFSHMGIDSMPWQQYAAPAESWKNVIPNHAIAPLHHLDASLTTIEGAPSDASTYDALEVPSPSAVVHSNTAIDAHKREGGGPDNLSNTTTEQDAIKHRAAAAAAAGLDHKPDAAWRERVKHIYGDKTKPFPYTEGYHFLIKYATANLDKADVLRIVRALAIFRPSLIALQMPLTEDDEIFVERSIQRTSLEFEKLIAFSGTPTVVWRRTCEIVVVGAEFSMLTQWSKEYLMGRYIYEFFDKPSILEYWEKFALHAFENTAQSIMMPIALKTSAGTTTRCAACFSIKRDIFDLPSLIVGNFLPILS